MQYCPRCGERVEPEDAYCFECGAELDRPAGGSDGEQDRGRRPERAGGGRRRERRVEPGRRGEAQGYGGGGSRGRVENLRTLWAAVVGVALASLETGARAALVLSDPEAVVEQAEELGVAGDINTDVLVVTAGIGVLVAVALAAVCLYYYRQGYVDRRFFWTLVGASAVGFLVGGGLSFVVTAGVGAYGLLVVLRREGSKEPQVTSP